MVEGNASMYLGSPRMAEMVIGEMTTLEEMGGARMHATVSGCGDNLAADDEDAIDQAQAYFTYLPQNWREDPPTYAARPPARELDRGHRPGRGARRPTTCTTSSTASSTPSRFFEVKPLFAPELIVGFGRLDGRPVGIVANNPMQKGGVLFVDSADKAARFIWCCDAFNIPLVFLADVPGFMVGTEVERQGIIRHGAKMITAVSEATVPKVVGDRAQGLRRRPLRHVRAGVRARGHPRPAHRQDRGHGPRGGGQRRLRQQDRRRSRTPTSGRRSSPSSARSTRRTSTCCAWPPSWSSTPSSTSATSATEVMRRLERAQGKDRHFSDRRHGVPPV